jgi:two-component system CheB/CheR fusion protein
MIVTDVNPDAIAVAKAGTYRLPPPASISRARFARFFDVNEGEYRVNEALRSLCRFSVQDVRGDAPATDLDLISCRNLLTFCLNGGEQQAAFEAFHRSLKPGGWLVIGKADTLAVPASLFSVVHREQRIFVRNPVE